MKVTDEVATHVLIPVGIAEQLKELSRRTRVTQSEYLREAVQDLLRKYGQPGQQLDFSIIVEEGAHD